ncbi:MAG: hypothetical protein IJO61_04150 [Oscillospiraceae bacterium]|nr:hypothetical protein [Oscillospiraceae bacterium]
MKKNVYSITLFEEVVNAVDRAALRNNMTRSGLINAILAEHLGLVTPEVRQKTIFEEISSLLSPDETFLVYPAGADSLFTVKSSIRFKYNPTISYSVVIYPGFDKFFGELRVRLRTRNPLLISTLESFLALWQKIEYAYFGDNFSQVGEMKFIRKLRTPRMVTTDTLGRASAKYIRLFNDCLTTHFNLYPDVSASAEYISARFDDYLKHPSEIV